MSLLSPFYLAGLLAVSLPVLFHLIRRSPRSRQAFSSLLFLRPSPPRLTRRSRLDHVLLLVLRAAVLVLAALAFSRPFFRAAVVPPAPPPAVRRTAVLVDASASMRREDLWRRAVERAEEAVREAGAAGLAAVLAYDASPRTVLSLEESYQAGADQAGQWAAVRLGRMTPSWGAADLGTALMAAADMLQSADPPPSPDAALQIVLISDMARGARLERLRAFAWPPEVRVALRPVLARSPNNAGLYLVGDPAAPPPARRLRVVNAAGSRRAAFQVRWAGPDGPLPDAPPREVSVPPGGVRTLPAPGDPPPGADRLLLTGDDHPFDNACYVAPGPRRPAEVAYLGDDPADDPQGARFYLQRLWPGDDPRGAALVAAEDASVLAPRRGPPPALAVLARSPAADELAQLAAYVEQGGVLLCAPGSPAEADAQAPLWGGASGAEERRADDAFLLTDIAFDHPLFQPLADPRFSDFTRVRFWRYRRLAPPAGPDAAVLARFDSGDPAIMERRRGRGAVVVLASSWRPADSQLARSTKFVPLLAGLLEQAAGPSGRAAYQVGQSIPIPRWLRAQGAGQVVAPDGRRIPMAAAQEALAGVEADAPGLYRFVYPAGRMTVAVNLDPAESRTGVLGPEELEQYGVVLGRAQAAVVDARRWLRMQDEQWERRQQWWRWLLAAAVVVAIGETWLAGRAARAAGRSP